MNTGLIESVPSPTDWVFGANIIPPVLQADRDYTSFLPIPEVQANGYIETSGCVTFSAWNCLETLHKRLYTTGTNKSDRFTVVKSGTVPGVGNSFQNVANSIRHDWSVIESEYPFVNTQAEYYKPLTDDLIKSALREQDGFITNSHWIGWSGQVDKEALWTALQYAPVQVTVFTWGELVNGVYQKPTTTDTNHAVMIFKGEYGKYWWIFDSYAQTIKQLAWDYYFGSAFQYLLTRNTMQIIKGDLKPDVFLEGQDGILYRIGAPGSLQLGKTAGIWGDVVEKPQSEVDNLPKGTTFGFLL